MRGMERSWEHGILAEQFLLVKEEVPEIEYDTVSRILKVEKKGQGKNGLCSGMYRRDR